MQRGVGSPQIEADLQVAHTDENHRAHIKHDEQHKVIHVLEQRRAPLFHANGHGERQNALHHMLLTHEQTGQHGQGGHEPDRADYSLDSRPRHEGTGLERRTNGIESLGADNGQGENAGGDGQPLAEVDDLAHSVAVDPVRVDLEGHAEGHAHAHHHQVAHGQVDQERVGHGAHLAVAREDEDDQRVPDQPQEEGDAVERHQRRRRRLLVPEELPAQLVGQVVGQPVPVAVPPRVAVVLSGRQVPNILRHPRHPVDPHPGEIAAAVAQRSRVREVIHRRESGTGGVWCRCGRGGSGVHEVTLKMDADHLTGAWL